MCSSDLGRSAGGVRLGDVRGVGHPWRDPSRVSRSAARALYSRLNDHEAPCVMSPSFSSPGLQRREGLPLRWAPEIAGKKTALINTIAIGLKKRFGLWLISNAPRNVNWVVFDVFLAYGRQSGFGTRNDNERAKSDKKRRLSQLFSSYPDPTQAGVLGQDTPTPPKRANAYSSEMTPFSET